MSRNVAAVGLLGLLCLTVSTGCDPLTRNRFDMIKVDVAGEGDVRGTIGEPTRVLPGHWHYERPERHLNVLIDFNDQGVVSRKQWIDAVGNEWFDSQPPQEETTGESIRVRTRR